MNNLNVIGRRIEAGRIEKCGSGGLMPYDDTFG